jgi:hypothetical protein
LWIQDQQGLHSKTLSKKKKEKISKSLNKSPEILNFKFSKNLGIQYWKQPPY